MAAATIPEHIYRLYAYELDQVDPRWFYADITRMSPGMAAQAWLRRDESLAGLTTQQAAHDPDREGQ